MVSSVYQFGADWSGVLKALLQLRLVWREFLPPVPRSAAYSLASPGIMSQATQLINWSSSISIINRICTIDYHADSRIGQFSSAPTSFDKQRVIVVTRRGLQT